MEIEEEEKCAYYSLSLLLCRYYKRVAAVLAQIFPPQAAPALPQVRPPVAQHQVRVHLQVARARPAPAQGVQVAE